jgi:succinate-semialdehyde dehydrogenase/glutarate-semialdehyde dehydrogenase
VLVFSNTIDCMPLISQNPATTEVLMTIETDSSQEVEQKLVQAKHAFYSWSRSSFEDRSKLMMNLSVIFRQKRSHLASLITLEMGCPISQSLAEIEKCAIICEYFALNSEEFLKHESIPFDAHSAYISFEPLGTLLHIAPWNYPFYLALRPAIPAIMAGNTVLMKHASNVPQCSQILEAIFEEAGFAKGVFQSLLVGSRQIADIIKNERVQIVSVIGSERAGSEVAKVAGESIKKTILELGGSDPFIVCSDADIDKAVVGAVQSRLRNCGQSCNAAKRFIIHTDVCQEFTEKLKLAFEAEIMGDPMDHTTTLGPLATEKSLQEITSQVERSVKMGAQIVTGGKACKLEHLSGYYYLPTILSHVHPDMPVFTEEVFGPVAPIVTFSNTEEAIRLANLSSLGLGASVWTKNLDLAKTIIPRIESGNVYVNSIVRGDPKLPYGGIKKSGYGREFGELGIKEFVNIKSVVIKEA